MEQQNEVMSLIDEVEFASFVRMSITINVYSEQKKTPNLSFLDAYSNIKKDINRERGASKAVLALQFWKHIDSMIETVVKNRGIILTYCLHR